MSSPPSRHSQTNKNRVDFLLFKLATAMIFVDLASSTKVEETAQRNYQHAIKAYETVERYLPKVRLDHGQRQTVEEKLAHLRVRLGEAGYQV